MTGNGLRSASRLNTPKRPYPDEFRRPVATEAM